MNKFTQLKYLLKGSIDHRSEYIVDGLVVKNKCAVRGDGIVDDIEDLLK